MTLGGYLQVLRERWKLVLIALVLGIGGAAAFTATATPLYSSQVTLFVSAQLDPTDPTGAYQGSLLSEQKVKSYVELLSSQRLSQDVIAATRRAHHTRKVVARNNGDISARHGALDRDGDRPSPARAQLLANSLGVQFGLLVADLERPANGKAPSVTARVVQRAQLSTSPVSPKPVRNIGLGAALGLLVGLGAAFARNALDTSVKSAEQLERVTGVPNLGTIAFDPKVRKRPLIVQEHPQAPRSEAFRQIRTSLQFIDVDRPNKMIVVTSSLPEEGKTTTLCNLAIAMAQAGNKVALVEADLRRPRAANYLGLEGAVGLTSVLAGQASLDDALQTWGDDLFSVLASGPVPPNPSELLASDRMRKLLIGTAGDLRHDPHRHPAAGSGHRCRRRRGPLRWSATDHPPRRDIARSGAEGRRRADRGRCAGAGHRLQHDACVRYKLLLLRLQLGLHRKAGGAC